MLLGRPARTIRVAGDEPALDQGGRHTPYLTLPYRTVPWLTLTYLTLTLPYVEQVMNRLYIKEADIYLAYRMQLAAKFVVICCMYGSALPIVYFLLAYSPTHLLTNLPYPPTYLPD